VGFRQRRNGQLLSSSEPGGLLRHLRMNGCGLKREGRSHSLWGNPINGVLEAVPWHVELSDRLARKICRRLGIPELSRCAAPCRSRY
jgi:hypothetical protein